MPPPPRPAPTSRRSRLLQWVGVGTLAAVFATSLTIAVWPASEADKARDRRRADRPGRQRALRRPERRARSTRRWPTSRSPSPTPRNHAGDRVDEQLSDTEDALSRAADGFAGAHTTDGWDADLYQAELDVAIDDLADQAQDIREDAPEVEQAFWDGFDSGLTTDLVHPRPPRGEADVNHEPPTHAAGRR